MFIKIYEIKDGEENLVGTIKVRKNSKSVTILEKVKEYISKNYNCNVRRALFTGKYDFCSQELNGHYVLFGDNLPFREISYKEVI